MQKSLRVAIASLDGKCINEHFGRAKKFYIADIFIDGNYKYMGERSVSPLCNEGEHSESALEGLIEILKDCKIILVARIGPPIKTALESKGITVLEHADIIEDTLSLLSKQIFDQQL